MCKQFKEFAILFKKCAENLKQTNIGPTHTSHTSSKLDWPTPAEGPVSPKLAAPDNDEAV